MVHHLLLRPEQEDPMAKYSHLNSEDRSHIETGLNNRQSFKEIGEKIGKDCSTISKEIRPHMVFRKTGAYGRPFNDCVYFLPGRQVDFLSS